MRLIRGLWTVHARFADGGGIVRATLLRIPGTRARWEFVATFKASDQPKWGEE